MRLKNQLKKLKQIDKQKTKSLMKHTAEAVKGLREYEEKKK